MYEHTSLQWRHNGRDSVSNHQPHDCLLNCLFRRRLKKTSKLRVTGHCAGNSLGTGEFPAQMASNAEMFPFDDVIMLRGPKWQPRWATVYPKKYAHGFVVLYFVVVMQSFIMNSHEVFIHIHQGCFAGTGAIVRLPQCQWSKPDGYGKISQCITTTQHSKAKTVCIFLGIYCMLQNMTRVRRFIIHSLKDPCIPLTTMRHIYGIVLITWSLAIFHQISSTILNDVICPTRSFPLFRIRSYCLGAPPVIFIGLLSVRISRHQINYPIGCLANKTKSIDSYRDICILSSTSHSMRMYIFINTVNTLWQHCACYPINLLIRIMYTLHAIQATLIV